MQRRGRLSPGTSGNPICRTDVVRHEDFPADGEFFRIDTETGHYTGVERLPGSARRVSRSLSARSPRAGSDNVA